MPAMTTRTKVWLSTAVFATVVAIYYPFSPGGSQHINMGKAEEHIKKIGPQIASDPRFKDVHLSPFTAYGGSLSVEGTVANELDLQALRSLVDNSRSPVTVAFRVFIFTPSATQPQT